MSLEKTLGALDKKYGKGSVAKVKDKVFANVERQQSGSLLLDLELGGGYPKGRIIEIYGPESSGKTTLTLHAMAEEQMKGGTVAFIDAEHTFDRQYAEAIGVDVDEVILNQPDNGEMAMEICKSLIESGEVDMIIVDSVAALTPKAEIDGEVGDSKMGLHARLMSQAMRMITGKMQNSNCTVIFINQLREKIGVMFGSPETTTGGNALKFYASVRLDIRAGQQIKDGDAVIGRQTKITVKKNKVGKPFGIVHAVMTFGQGLDAMAELLEIAVELDVVQKSGSWFSYDGTNVGQGKVKTLEVLRDNPDLYDQIEDKVKKIMYPNVES